MQQEMSYEEKIIRNYIANHTSPDDYYDEEIAEEESFEVHYHLSSLRKGILSWYDFAPDGELLEIGGGYGALTGLFCQRCAAVTVFEPDKRRAEVLQMRHKRCDNLHVISGDWRECELENQFDYVVVLEATRCDRVFFDRLAKLLKPKGRLLISFANCFGLKYICGMPERYTDKRFGGIIGYAGGGQRYSFSRGEITEALEQSEFAKYKFYYPLPDDRLPQVIYTDGHLPEANVSERLQSYYESTDRLLCKEEKLYEEVISQGAFPFMANSFLVECVMDGEPGDISYATVSSDRGKERGFATTIHQSGVVCKKPLYPQGRENIKRIYENITDLAVHGIPVVEHSYDMQNAMLALPFVALPTLADYVRKVVSEDGEVFIRILRDLYNFILRSSEEAEVGQNAMLSRMRECFKGDEEAEKRLETADWGPILKTAYIELISLNCFYDEEKQRYWFFDQEFVRENYPAKYVLFRTIAISYVFIPKMESYVPLQRVKDIFGLNELWAFFEREEALFLDEVRLRATYKQFLRWVHDPLPNVEEREAYHDYIYGRKAGRQLILFGTGKRFEDYMQGARGWDVPVFAVDNDSAKWGMVKCGVEIRSPQEILKLPRNKRQVLICCVNTASIEEQLIEMGVCEFWTYSEIIG